ncbi:MAG: hypothetical protein AB2693_14140, partial [Candidatus Thiodiazotropha sp.]
ATINPTPVQPLKDFVAELIPALIPAITQSVVSALQDVGIVKKPTTTAGSTKRTESNRFCKP